MSDRMTQEEFMEILKDYTQSDGKRFGMQLSFGGENLSHLDFSNLWLIDSYFGESNCADGTFIKTTLSYANFTKANMNRVTMTHVLAHDSVFDQVVLSKGNIAYSNFTKALLRRTNFGYTTFKNVEFTEADLSFTKMTNATLTLVDFEKAYLEKAKLFKSIFKCTDFNYAKLQKADLSYSEFINCDFTGANLESADFSNSHIVDCDFTKALSLPKAKFTNAKLENNKFRESDLEKLKGAILVGRDLEVV